NPRLAIVAKPDLTHWPKKCHCDSCTRAKFHKHSHSGTRPTMSQMPWAPGEYITCDLFGPLLQSRGGAKYVAFYLDLKSKFVYAKPLKLKTDNYQDCKARSGKSVRFFKTDGDGIFTPRRSLLGTL